MADTPYKVRTELVQGPPGVPTTVQVGGVALPPRPTLNLLSGFTGGDNPTNNSTDITNTAPGAVVGVAQIGANTFVEEDPQDNVTIAAGTQAPVWSLKSPPVSFAERVVVSVLFSFCDAATGSHIGYITRMIAVVNRASGGFTNPTGSVNSLGTPADWDITPNTPNNIDPALLGTTCQLQATPSGVIIGYVTAPAGVTLAASAAAVSVTRTRLPGTGPVAIVAAGGVSPNSGPGTGGTSHNVTLTAQAGTSFLGATAVTLAGVPAAIVSIASNGLSMVVTPGVYSGFPANFTGPAIVTNPNGPGGDNSTGYNYTSTTGTSFSLAGGAAARAHVYYANNGVTQSAGTVTAWADQNTTNAVPLVVNGTPGYVASSSTFTPAQPSVTTPGSAGTNFGANAVNLLSTDSIFFWAIVKWTSPGSLTEVLFDYSSAAQTFQLAQNNGPTVVKPFLNDNARSIAAITSDIHGAAHLIWAFDQNSAVGSGGKAQISVDNGAPVSTTGTGPTITASGNVIQIGQTGQFEFVEIGWVPFTGSNVPSASFLSNLHAWAQSQYGTP